jgi:hypothetical protein
MVVNKVWILQKVPCEYWDLEGPLYVYVYNFATLRETENDDWLEMFVNNLWLPQKS